MNHGAHYWAAFRATRTDWKRVKFKRGCCPADPRFGAGVAMAPERRTIVVRAPVYLGDDPACCLSGGARTGRWRWQERRLGLVDVARRAARNADHPEPVRAARV